MSDADLSALTDRLDAVLPQTQCRKCGFDGCRPYAEAMAAGASPINRCPPGGDAGIKTLAAILNTSELALNPACGETKPALLALIAEEHCIGCTLCIQACPVDAIVGAPKRMHSVLLAHCTGCELCIPPCPVDCIELVEVSTLATREVAGARTRNLLRGPAAADGARARFTARSARLSHGALEIALESENKNSYDHHPGPTTMDEGKVKREAVMQALLRARKRRASITP